MTSEMHSNLRDLFRKVFEARWDRSDLANYDELREKFALHMAETADTLTGLAKVYEAPGSCDTACVTDHVTLFFVDSLPHLMAAAQIYDEIPQTFEEQNGVHNWQDVVSD